MKNKGITLIALIITIIVMLILVAVTVSMSMNGGLFSYAGNAAKGTELAKYEEQNIANIEDGLSTDEFIERFSAPEPPPAYSNDLLDENNVLTVNAIYTDANNATVEIPKGFRVSDVSEEQTKADGLVIVDKIGNEFVWVPVDDYSLFHITYWNNNARDTNIAIGNTEDASSDPTGKYNNMTQSVKNHKGFYIGRYEAGEIENGKIVVQRDKIPFTEVDWGDSTTSIGTTGAVYYCLNMYLGDDYTTTSTLCYGAEWDATLDFIKSSKNVTSSTNWGNFKNNAWTINRQSAKFLNGSTWTLISSQSGGQKTKTSSQAIKLTTGASDSFKAKNIFDIAGNVSEWTMETMGTDCVSRGQNYYSEGNKAYGASGRSYGPPIAGTGSYVQGFRPALYL